MAASVTGVSVPGQFVGSKRSRQNVKVAGNDPAGRLEGPVRADSPIDVQGRMVTS
jgi:hypothetical protein